MKRCLVLLCLACSCSSPPAPGQSEGATEAFKQWIQAAVDGNAQKTFDMLSLACKSEWIYKLLEQNDPTARQWRGTLTGPARTDLDLWWGRAHKEQSGRVYLLEPTVAADPSFFRLYQTYFTQAAGEIRAEFSRLQIAQVYSDDTGVTLTAKPSPTAAPVLCGFVFEGGGWKLDHMLEPVSRRR